MEKNDRYYGSDLNRFVDNNCMHEMTAINVDLMLFRWSKKTFYIVESKHTGEGMRKGQRQLLEFTAKILKVSNRLFPFTEWKFGCYIVIGDEPYDSLKVEDLIKKRKFEIIGRKDVIAFLELEPY